MRFCLVVVLAALLLLQTLPAAALIRLDWETLASQVTLRYFSPGQVCPLLHFTSSSNAASGLLRLPGVGVAAGR